MPRPRPGLAEDGDDVLQRLPHLGHEALGEAALGVPADLPANHDQPALANEAVAVALGRGPARWEEGGEGCCAHRSVPAVSRGGAPAASSRSAARWSLSVGVRGSAA